MEGWVSRIARIDQSRKDRSGDDAEFRFWIWLMRGDEVGGFVEED